MSGPNYQYGHRVDVVDPADAQRIEDEWEAGNLEAPRPWLEELWAWATDDLISALCFWLSVALFLAMIFSPQIAEALQ